MTYQQPIKLGAKAWMMDYKICDYAHLTMGFLYTLIGCKWTHIYAKNKSKARFRASKWWLETYNPQINMVRNFAHEKIRELEKKLQLK